MHLIQRLRVLFAATKSDMAEQHTDVPNELAAGWAESLDLDTLDYLYAESRARLLEQLQAIDALAAKARTVAGFVALVIIATGVLGDLRISFTEDRVASSLSMIAVIAFVGVLAGAAVIMWPHPIRMGVLPTWLARYSIDESNATALRAATTEIQVDAFAWNVRTMAHYGAIIRGMMALAAIEVSAVVALFIAQA